MGILLGSRRRAASESALRNAVNTLYANIRFQDPDESIRSIAVTSSVPNEGKTTVALALAEAMAASGKRTLLVEGDMRRRSLAGRLGVHSRVGLFAALSGQAKLADAVLSAGQPNLWFLDAEPGLPSPSDILSSEKFDRALTSLEKSFDYVVVDTPPLGRSSTGS